MPVSAVTSSEIETVGSLKAEKVSRTPAIRPSGKIVELDHADFDDFVALRVEPGRLGIQQHGCARFLTDRWQGRQPWHQAPKNPVVRRQAQSVGHRGQADRVLKHRIPISGCGQADRSRKSHNTWLTGRQVSERQAICGLSVDIWLFRTRPKRF
jgi:hypothetical protein